MKTEKSLLDDLDIIADIDLLGRSPVRGHIVGNRETANRIFTLLNDGAERVTIEAKPLSNGTTRFQSEVAVSRIGVEVQADYFPEAPVQAVCDFDCLEVVCSDPTLFPPENITGGEDAREIWYYLNGERAYWPNQDLPGRPRRKEDPVPIVCEPEFAVSVGISARNFLEQKPSPDGVALVADRLVLVAKTIKTRSELNDEQFIGQAESIVNDILLLMSFLSRSWITWYRCQLISPRFASDRIRRDRDLFRPRVEWRLCPINHAAIDNFMPRALIAIKRLREQRLDPTMALVSAIAANESRYLEETFSNLFISLERLKDQYSQKADLEFVLPKKDFEQLSKAVRDAIRKHDVSNGHADKIDYLINKVPDLNRPPLWSVVSKMLDEYSVTWRDLYPPDLPAATRKISKPEFIDLRNRLFHSRSQVSIADLSLEIDRLRAVVERLLLKMLDWPQVDEVPYPDILKKLQSPPSGM